MQLDAILEVAIGLVFVWLVISIATLEIQNRIGAWLNWRAEHLERAVLNMLKEPATVEQFYAHPLIMEYMPKDKDGKPLADKKGKLKRPESIPSQKFAMAAAEIMLNAGREQRLAPDTMKMEDLTAGLAALMKTNPNLAQVNLYMLPNMQKAAADMDDAMQQHRRNIEGWFNDVMAQASGLYKLHAQKMAFWIGLVIALTLNLDTINVAQKLWQEPTLRAAIVAQAQVEAQQGQPTGGAIGLAENLKFPVGWTTTPLDTTACSAVDLIDWQLAFRSAGQCRAVAGLPAFNNFWGWIVKLCGYLLSAAAAAQGAPFWFDLLRKLIGVKQQPAPGEDKKSATA